jgi:DNA-binding HxlR family transcriptional regulator
MATRTYGQYCGVARAMEIVGERWALLIVRDLIPGPKRFTDLRRGLPRIPTNVLSARLKELERDGIVYRRVLPRPSGSVVYELTEYGRELEEIVPLLLRWGLKSLGEPRPDDTVNPSTLIIGLHLMFNPEGARGLRATYTLDVDGAVVHVSVDDGALELGEGPMPGADVAIETDAGGLRALIYDEPEAGAQARDTGAVRVTGDAGLLEAFVTAFRPS